MADDSEIFPMVITMPDGTTQTEQPPEYTANVVTVPGKAS